VCGNYIWQAQSPMSSQGSPPRVRELPQGSDPRGSRSRITPACAGITPFITLNYLKHRDHPRVCGNYQRQTQGQFCRRGSPPRVRELPTSNAEITTDLRITPACAGITATMAATIILPGDHPRVCGNYRSDTAGKRHGEGSPPRVRELLRWPAVDFGGLRITPACAGITCQKRIS